MNRRCLRCVLGLIALWAVLLAGPGSIPWAGAVALPSPDLARPAGLMEGSGLGRGRELAGSEWLVQRVDIAKTFNNMGDRSLALDASGYPHIAYGADGLYYAWHDGAEWHLEIADYSTNVGKHTALALDEAGRPHISYYDQAAANLNYAHYDGTAWQIEVVDAGVGSC